MTISNQSVRPAQQESEGAEILADSGSEFDREAMKTNVLMWRLFMSSSMKASIHLGPKYTENLEVYKNTDFEEIL